jgi:uncharacterized membrane protein (DUF485 family)
MGHGPAVKLGKDNAQAYKSRLGVYLFIVYTLFYAGFIAINSIKPSMMETVIAGQTFAVIYGFALIVVAFIMAIIYNSLCNAAEARLNK